MFDFVFKTHLRQSSWTEFHRIGLIRYSQDYLNETDIDDFNKFFVWESSDINFGGFWRKNTCFQPFQWSGLQTWTFELPKKVPHVRRHWTGLYPCFSSKFFFEVRAVWWYVSQIWWPPPHPPQCHEILVMSWSFRWQVRLLCIWGLLRFLYSVAWLSWGPQFALLDVWWLRTEFISMGRGHRTRMWWSAMQTRWLSLVNTDLFTFFICAFVRCNWPEAAIHWNQSTKDLTIGIATPSRSWINPTWCHLSSHHFWTLAMWGNNSAEIQEKRSPLGSSTPMRILLEALQAVWCHLFPCTGCGWCSHCFGLVSAGGRGVSQCGTIGSKQRGAFSPSLDSNGDRDGQYTEANLRGMTWADKLGSLELYL